MSRRAMLWNRELLPGVRFTLHRLSGEEFQLSIPGHQDWHWGQMPNGRNYVSDGIGIKFIKETYEEFRKVRNDAFNQYYKLGK